MKKIIVTLLLLIILPVFANELDVKCKVDKVIAIPTESAYAEVYFYIPLSLTVLEPRKINKDYSDCLIIGYAMAVYDKITFNKKLLLCDSSKGAVTRELTGTETFQGFLMFNSDKEKVEMLQSQLANHTLCGQKDCLNAPKTSNGLTIYDFNSEELESILFDLRLLFPMTVLSPYDALTVRVQ